MGLRGAKMQGATKDEGGGGGGGGEWVAIFMEAGVDSSRHHDLAV